MNIKITKQLLNNYSRYKKEISFLKAEIEEMNYSESGLGSSVIFDYSTGYPRPQAVVGFDSEQYEKRKKVLENKCEKVAVVEKWIEDIEDIQTRTVFRLRYIQQKSWIQIAKEIGYSGKEDYVRIRIRDNYLKKVGIL